jgi:hypothetical protein
MMTNTIKIAIATQTILALDLGKYKSVACIYRRPGRCLDVAGAVVGGEDAAHDAAGDFMQHR